MYYALEESLIWCLLTLAAISPVLIPWLLFRFFKIHGWRMLSHCLSCALAAFLVIMWILAYRAYIINGYDDGSSSMAAFIGSLGIGILLILNIAIYLPPFRPTENGGAGK